MSRLSFPLLELQQLKAELDRRIKNSDTISGRFHSKPRRHGLPSILPPPSNPVCWAIAEPVGDTEHIIIEGIPLLVATVYCVQFCSNVTLHLFTHVIYK